MANLKGPAYCKALLGKKKIRCEERYLEYEMKKENIRELVLFDDPRFRQIKSHLGWCAKAVDSLADRLVFKGWKNDNFNLGEIFQMNNPDIFFDSAIISALITSCSFVWISLDDTGYPKLEVIDGRRATGVLDPATNLLEEGYAVLESDDYGPTMEAYFEPGRTTFYRRGQDPYVVPNSVDFPLLVPIIYRPDAKRPFGHSRISRSCMALVESARRTIRRSELSSEFYSFPQKYVTGLSESAEPMEGQKATASSFIQFQKDEDGDKPVVGQFTQQSMQPYLDQMRTLASLFAGETGLTLDDLGFVSDNPSSAEAIKASHESLRLTAKKAQRTFGSCFLNVGFVAACLRDDIAYQRRQFYLTQPLWEPIFEPDAAMLSGIGDGAIKLNQAVPGYFGRDNLSDLTGIVPSEQPVTEADDE